jgi:DeoR family transcriptional regulator, suf operon transcriptional repressor
METSEGARPGVSPAKKEVLFLLKRNPELSLAELARLLSLTKMAALRRLSSLETEGLVAREFRAHGVGRPQVFFRLTPDSRRLFPSAYEQTSMYALNFIEQRLGRPAVVDLLRERSRDLYQKHRPQMVGKSLPERVSTLAEIRDRGGYMAERGTTRKSGYEFLEHNCPIRSLAAQYGEACEIERKMFESLLRADVETTHRVVAGNPVCRFLIRARRSEVE